MRSWARGTWIVLKKELKVELSTLEILVTAGLFGVLITVLTSLAFYLDPLSAPRLAPGVLWIAASFAGVLAIGRAWGREREADAIRGLMLAPIPRAAIYWGKMVGTLTLVLSINFALLVLVAVLFRVDLGPRFVQLTLVLFMGTLGFVALGTLFGAMSVRTRARELLLSVVLLPLASPGLLAGVVASRQLIGSAPFEEIAIWYRLLAAYDLVALTMGTALFEPLMRD